jgi:hypothetical protein
MRFLRSSDDPQGGGIGNADYGRRFVGGLIGGYASCGSLRARAGQMPNVDRYAVTPLRWPLTLATATVFFIIVFAMAFDL